MSLTRRRFTGSSRQKGSVLIEFALCVCFFWLPLFAGLLIAGQNMIRAMQVTQVCRDAAHMFAFGADFTQSSYRNLLVNLAPALGLSTSASLSHGVAILSQVRLIDSTCDGTNIPGHPVACSNSGYYVVVQRIVIGNTAIRTSFFGTPASQFIDPSTGNVSQAGYLNDASTRASAGGGASFAPPIILPTTQSAFIGELYVTSPGSAGWSTTGPPSISARFIF